MRVELFGSVLMAAGSLLLFRRFESGTPLPGRLVKWAVYLGVSALLSARPGRPWSLIWTFGLPVMFTTLHCTWCWRHGIHPLTSEPRGKYRALRGQASGDSGKRP